MFVGNGGGGGGGGGGHSDPINVTITYPKSEMMKTQQA